MRLFNINITAHTSITDDGWVVIDPGMEMPIEDCRYKTLATRDYCGDYIYLNDTLERIITPVGYMIPTQEYEETYPQGYYDSFTHHAFIKDYQGNIRSVINEADEVVEINQYYPYGGILYDGITTSPTKSSSQPYKYSGKEYDTHNGLNLYDFHARQQDPYAPHFTTIDPLAEINPHISPYVFCAANPINIIDPTGLDTVNITYKDNKWVFQDPIIAEGDDVFIVTVNDNIETYTFSEGAYGKRVNCLNLYIDDNKSGYTLGVYHISGAKEGGTGYTVTPGGKPSTTNGSGRRIPDGFYPIIPPHSEAEWRRPGIGGSVIGRGIRVHYGGKNARSWTEGCYVISYDYTINKDTGSIDFPYKRSLEAANKFDELLGASSHYNYTSKRGKERIGSTFDKPISHKLNQKSRYKYKY